MKGVRLATRRLLVRDLRPGHCRKAAQFHRENLEFHKRWEPGRPSRYYTPAAQRRILSTERRSPDRLHLWVFESGEGTGRGPGAIVGSVTLSGIVRGFFQSCFLGYKLDARYVGRGYMREALCAVIDHAFTVMGLHRLEANVMPDNDRSMKLVSALGFREEGRATGYLKIQGEWEDHIHMVLLAEWWSGCK